MSRSEPLGPYPLTTVAERIGGVFPVSVDESLRIAELDRRLRQAGVVVDEWRQALAYLGPILCGNPADQQRLANLAEHQFAGAAPPPQPPVLVREVARLDRIDRMLRPFAPILAILVGLLLVAGLTWLLLSSRPQARTEAAPVRNQPAAEAPAGQLTVLKILLGMTPLACAVIALGHGRQRRRALRRGPDPGGGQTLPLRIRLADFPLFRPGSLRIALRDLRRHRLVPSGRIDAAASVAATIRGSGFVRLVEGRRPVLPDHLFLVDRSSRDDQMAALADLLAERLAEEGVMVSRYDFRGDPRELKPPRRPGERRRPVALETLQQRFAGERLLVFAEVGDFWDPVQNDWRPWVADLAAFGAPAVLTPRPRSQWGRRERGLARLGFLLTAATSEGLADLAFRLRTGLPARPPSSQGSAAQALDRRLEREPYLWTGERQPEPHQVEGLVADLRAALGAEAFLHLCAIAVFPHLDSRLSAMVGQVLRDRAGAPLFSEERFAALGRLPWLRQSSIPDWLRLALVRDLDRDPADAEAVRAAWTGILQAELDPAGPGTLDLRVAPITDRAIQRRLAEAARPAGRMKYRDALLLTFLQGDRLPELGVAAPESLVAAAPDEEDPTAGEWMVIGGAALAAMLLVFGVSLAAPLASVDGLLGFSWPLCLFLSLGGLGPWWMSGQRPDWAWLRGVAVAATLASLPMAGWLILISLSQQNSAPPLELLGPLVFAAVVAATPSAVTNQGKTLAALAGRGWRLCRDILVGMIVIMAGLLYVETDPTAPTFTLPAAAFLGALIVAWSVGQAWSLKGMEVLGLAASFAWGVSLANWLGLVDPEIGRTILSSPSAVVAFGLTGSLVVLRRLVRLRYRFIAVVALAAAAGVAPSFSLPVLTIGLYAAAMGDWRRPPTGFGAALMVVPLSFMAIVAPGFLAGPHIVLTTLLVALPAILPILRPPLKFGGAMIKPTPQPWQSPTAIRSLLAEWTPRGGDLWLTIAIALGGFSAGALKGGTGALFPLIPPLVVLAARAWGWTRARNAILWAGVVSAAPVVASIVFGGTFGAGFNGDPLRWLMLLSLAYFAAAPVLPAFAAAKPIPWRIVALIVLPLETSWALSTTVQFPLPPSAIPGLQYFASPNLYWSGGDLATLALLALGAAGVRGGRLFWTAVVGGSALLAIQAFSSDQAVIEAGGLVRLYAFPGQLWPDVTSGVAFFYLGRYLMAARDGSAPAAFGLRIGVDRSGLSISGSVREQQDLPGIVGTIGLLLIVLNFLTTIVINVGGPRRVLDPSLAYPIALLGGLWLGRLEFRTLQKDWLQVPILAIFSILPALTLKLFSKSSLGGDILFLTPPSTVELWVQVAAVLGWLVVGVSVMNPGRSILAGMFSERGAATRSATDG